MKSRIIKYTFIIPQIIQKLALRIVTVNMVVSHVRCIVRGVSKGFRKPP